MSCKHPEIGVWKKWFNQEGRHVKYMKNHYCLKCYKRIIHNRDKIFIIDEMNNINSWKAVIDTRLEEGKTGKRKDVVIIKNV